MPLRLVAFFVFLDSQQLLRSTREITSKDLQNATAHNGDSEVRNRKSSIQPMHYERTYPIQNLCWWTKYCIFENIVNLITLYLYIKSILDKVYNIYKTLIMLIRKWSQHYNIFRTQRPNCDAYSFNNLWLWTTASIFIISSLV